MPRGSSYLIPEEFFDDRRVSLERRGRRSADDEDIGTEAGAHRRAAADRADIAAMSEALAPAEARDKGISEDAAREELSGGVDYPEGPFTGTYHNLKRLFTGDTSPRGEASIARIGRLKGRAAALGEKGQSREQAMKDFLGTLKAGGQMEDASGLDPILKDEATRAGYPTLGTMKFRKPTSKNLVELFQNDPEGAKQFMKEAAALKGGRGAGGAGSAQERILNHWIDAEAHPDDPKNKAALKVFHRLHNKARAGTTVADRELTAYLASPEGQLAQGSSKPKNWTDDRWSGLKAHLQQLEHASERSHETDSADEHDDDWMKSLFEGDDTNFGTKDADSPDIPGLGNEDLFGK
jgi:hypothetical protein